MATRPVTINVFRPGGGEPWVGGVVEFTLVKGGYSSLAHYPKEAISATVPPSGLVEVDLWVNEESQIPTQWRARLPSGETAVFSVPPGTTPIAVEILRAIGDTPTTQIPSVTAQLEALIQIHNSDPIAHPGLGGGGPGGPGGGLTTLTYSPSGNYTLSVAPSRPDLSLLFVNGAKQVYGADYTINGTVLSWVSTSLSINAQDIIEAYLT
jgi:hypothetical protein